MVKDREAWCVAVPGVSKSWTWLSDWTTTKCGLQPPSHSYPKAQCLCHEPLLHWGVRGHCVVPKLFISLFQIPQFIHYTFLWPESFYVSWVLSAEAFIHPTCLPLGLSWFSGSVLVTKWRRKRQRYEVNSGHVLRVLSWKFPKETATHSSVLAWRIPGMGSHRVGHDWSDLAVAAAASLLRVSNSTFLYFFSLLVLMSRLC